MIDIQRKGTAIYFVPVGKEHFSKWEYYEVDLDMLNASFSKVIVCHSILSFIRAIVSSRATVVYCWWWHRSVICVVLSRLIRIPVYVTGAVHMYDESGSPDYFSKSFIFRFACQLSWRLASCNLFISKSQYRQITSHQKVNNPRVLKSSLIASYDITQLKTAVIPKDGDQKTCLLTIVWMTVDQLKRKNVYEVLESLKLLVDRGITNFEWIVAGGESNGRGELEVKINELGLESYVTVICDISNTQKQDLYAKADLYVQPSYYEGFGNAVLEAMSYGVPAVVSRNTAQPEVTGDSGFLLEEIGSEDIAKAISNYLSLSVEWRVEHRELVRQTIVKRHLFESRLDEFARILEDK